VKRSLRAPVASAIGVVLLIALSLPLLSAGQQDAPATQQPVPTFRLATEYVEMDVRVLDNKGQFIANIDQREVTLSEDGVRQTIDTFVPLIRGQRHPGASPLGAPSSIDPLGETPETVQRAFVLFLDDLQVDFQRTPQTIKLATEFIGQYLDADDWCAVITPGGASTGAATLTRDRTAALAAVKRFMGQKTEPESIALFRGQQDHTDPQRAFEASGSLRALHAVVQGLGTIRGASKSVVMFSEGMNYNYEDVRRPNASSLLQQQEEMLAVATLGNVAVHVIDPRMLYANQELVALGAPVAMGRDGGETSTGLAWRRLTDGFRNDIGRARNSLRLIASRTGGAAGIGSNNLRPVFAQIMDASAGFYQVGYRSSNPRQPGKEHKVKVTVSRAKVRVVARSGYREPKGAAAVR